MSHPVRPMLVDRRTCLQWSARALAGIAVPGAGLALASCGGSGTPDTLPRAPVLRAEKGRLNVELRAEYAEQTLPFAPAQGPVYPAPSTDIRTRLRSYNGRYMAPTLALDIGDTLRVRLVNALPANVDGQSSMAYLNHQNSTNLHFHGLHVDPKQIRPGVYGDYVVDHPEAGVRPGQSRWHEIAIPPNHTDGIYWYHPHLHGATNTQVLSGMFGAILIRDPANPFTADPEIEDRVIFVHKLRLNAQGAVDSFYDSLTDPHSAFLLNGALQPTLVMRPGQVQRWHVINASMLWPLNLVLDQHVMQAYARDGNSFDQRYMPMNDITASQWQGAAWPGTVIYPGGRLSILVQASQQPGTYELRSVSAPASDKDEIVARVVVEGAPSACTFPAPSSLPHYADHAPITDEELARNGGHQRHLVLSVVSPDSADLPQPIPANEPWFIPDADNAPSGSKKFVFAAGRPGPAGLVPFQSALTQTQTVPLNAVEEWTLHNGNSYPHPFHIHVNDCYVVRVNEHPVTPFWADTLPLPPNGSITFRSRFTDYTGAFVWHCHALNHEDLGMMQVVEVV